MSETVRPKRIRLEASSLCQLRCPSCPAHSGDVPRAIGSGFLALSDFRSLLDQNPQLEEIELSNYGEIFLNPDLLGILKCAHEHRVAMKADTGTNLNRVSEDVLEGLVKYGLRSMCCSIDGASDKTYRRYRVNGSFPTVMENIRRLNAFKEAYASNLPRLAWQFVVFGHNEREVARARELAAGLNMAFNLKLAWDPEFSPVTDEESLRKEIGAATREEYRQRFGRDYVQSICHELWNQPQVNWDGRVLGCCRNFWGDFGGNVFADGLTESVNGPRMLYAREMLLGRRPAKEGIPCSTCDIFLGMRAGGNWLDETRISEVWALPGSAGERTRSTDIPRLTGQVHALAVPLALDKRRAWASHPILSGSVEGLGLFSAHASVLTNGSVPHRPHVHEEEELLLLLSGEVELMLADAPAPGEDGRVQLRPGSIRLLPVVLSSLAPGDKQ
jgi:MoaA/NifB/PqqE/SkfB family radical SAM enzyme